MLSKFLLVYAYRTLLSLTCMQLLGLIGSHFIAYEGSLPRVIIESGCQIEKKLICVKCGLSASLTKMLVFGCPSLSYVDVALDFGLDKHSIAAKFEQS